MFERPFVLAPLATLAPDLVPPDWEAEFTRDGSRLGVWEVGNLDALT
jgi:7,8-dihydro-6-hydroxymethylpterin-pyrophosphokinase